MKIVAMIFGLMFTGALFADVDEDQRYVISSSILMIQGEQIPVTLLVDSRTGKTWYVGLVGEGPRAVPMWQSVPYYPGNRTTPAQGAGESRSGGQGSVAE